MKMVEYIAPNINTNRLSKMYSESTMLELGGTLTKQTPNQSKNKQTNKKTQQKPTIKATLNYIDKFK